MGTESISGSAVTPTGLNSPSPNARDIASASMLPVVSSFTCTRVGCLSSPAGGGRIASLPPQATMRAISTGSSTLWHVVAVVTAHGLPSLDESLRQRESPKVPTTIFKSVITHTEAVEPLFL